MTYRFDDTHVIDEKIMDNGKYVLAHSEDCAEQRIYGWSLRFYEDKNTDPWSPFDHPHDDIDFKDLQDGLTKLQNFTNGSDATLINWIKAEVG